MTNGVYSEYELRAMSIKFAGGSYQTANCVGTSGEELVAKVITKKCRGVVVKTVVKGDGTGTLSLTMHMPYAIYKEAYGMELDTLIEGVQAYGRNSVHESFSIVQDVYDEDGVEKLKAYPNCIMQSGVARTIENGAEEVAEIELEVSIMPDEYENCMYEAIANEVTVAVKNAWMTSFTPSLVQGSGTNYTVTQTLTNVTSNNNTTSIRSGGDYIATYTANAGKTLPGTVTVKVGSSTLVSGTGYIYSSATGILCVPNVTGNLTITVVGA